MKPFPLRDPIAHIVWKSDRLLVLDQRLLPRKIKYVACRTAAEVAEAIRSMALRGAPLIGVAAAYGMALAARRGPQELARAGLFLRRARPTAVNLMHAVDAMIQASRACGKEDLARGLARAAVRFHESDLEFNRRMAALGASLLKKGSRIMTHCNAGALATAGLGTAVGVIRYAHHLGKVAHVYPCETRPYLQGSRLTLWELMQAGVPSTLVTDNMAAHVMKTCGIDAVVVGSDRIAANADVCNKIGTYGLAILARYHSIPFYVVAPTTTVDLATPDGSRIPIEERSAAEVLTIFGRPIAPRGAQAHHFAFDVTPHELVTAIVTERGIVSPANGPNLKKVIG
ncbi:MAG TPA: S-methyl-5-thioribose-1-phosphate isomerase [Elusimicrobia bacterium]|nr:S-methyl-5-thioribose-1-phosphate isomerase [Elusimicrobiota bacterium]HBT62456.1 S-methyl-5-thioribose-1-phosphate isomerase [Elusimicrobiota bacterium]